MVFAFCLVNVSVLKLRGLWIYGRVNTQSFEGIYIKGTGKRSARIRNAKS